MLCLHNNLKKNLEALNCWPPLSLLPYKVWDFELSITVRREKDYRGKFRATEIINPVSAESECILFEISNVDIPNF